MKKLRPFRLSDECISKLDSMCNGNRTAWIEKVIESGGGLSEKVRKEAERRGKELGVSAQAFIEMAVFGYQKSTVEQVVPPLPEPTDKRAAFNALKQKFSGTPVLEKPEVEEGPTFPFEVDVGDDTWTVWNRGTRYGYQIDGVGGGLLTEERAKQLWKLKK